MNKRKHKKKTIVLSLLLPIGITTILIIGFALLVLAVMYKEQSTSSAIQTNLEILSQTEGSLELLHSHISEVAVDISQKPYLSDVLKRDLDTAANEWDGRQKIGNLFAASPNAMVDYEMMIFGENGLAVSSGNGGVLLSAEEIMEQPFFDTAVKKGKITYSSLPTGISFSTRDNAVVIGCKALKDTDGRVYGGVLISIKEESLRNFYRNFTNKGTSILLLNNNGVVLSSSNLEEIGEKDFKTLYQARDNRKNNLDYEKLADGGIILSRYISFYDTYLVSRISPNVIIGDFLPPVWMIVILGGAIVSLVLGIAFIIYKNLKPLRELSDSMSEVTELPKPISLEGAIEVEQIADSYNKMIHTLQEYLERLDRARQKERQDELDLLQMQINPHFLYNTLDSIKHLIVLKSEKEACMSLDSLISLLRNTLNKTNTLVSIEEEIANIENYITIVQPRYGGMISTQIEVEETCMEYQIPNLILQPIIENAFFHAFSQCKKGLIRIYVGKEDEKIVCQIIDNGDGISEEKLKEMECRPDIRQSKSRIGIANVKERLDMLYPAESEFELISEPGYGTIVRFSIPALRMDGRESLREK